MREPALRSRQLSNFSTVHGFQQGVARGEVAIQGSRSDFSLPGNIVQAGVGARARERLLRDFQDALAVALGVSARLRSWFSFLAISKTATGDTLRLSITITEAFSVFSPK